MTAGQLERLGVIGAVLAALVGPAAGVQSETAEPVAVNVAGQGWPWLSAGAGRPVPMALGGTVGPAQGGPALGTPQALAAGDFDEDGVRDLVSAYAGTGGGLLVLHRGNVDSIYPEAPGAQARRVAGTSTAAPFLPAVRAFPVPEAPALLAVGDFDNDGHLDVVTAAAGATRLWWRRGDGHGGLGAPQAVDVDGAVTALVAGEINRPDELTDLVVAIAGWDGAQLLVFESPLGALRGRPEVFALPAPASALALGDLGDPLPGLAVAAGPELVLIHGRDRRLSEDAEAQASVPPARITRHPLGRVVMGLALGHLTRADVVELALLGADGTLSVMTPGATPGPRAPALLAMGPWGAGARLVRANASAFPLDDLVVVDPAMRQLHVLNAGDPGRRVEPLRVAWDVAGAPVAALPMRLNRDALSDLVVLRAGGGSPVAVVLTEPAHAFVVNSTGDEGNKDGFERDQRCLTVAGTCTLRAALARANRLPGATQIDFAIGSGPRSISTKGFSLEGTSAMVIINGWSQPGFAGTPLIRLTASGAGDGLVLIGSRSTVRGLIITNFATGAGIAVEGSATTAAGGHVVEGNLIGTDTGGTTGLGNDRGISIACTAFGSTGNRIGGTAKQARNVIAGNLREGIVLCSKANQVQGNYIGLDPTGMRKVPNHVGVRAAGISSEATANDNVIGGTAATGGARNTISGDVEWGVKIEGFADRTQLLNNFIGTNAMGSARVENRAGGVLVDNAQDAAVGRAGAGNVISGNDPTGIEVKCEGRFCTGIRIQGNRIGTDAAGTAGLPPSRSAGAQLVGVLLYTEATIGGTAGAGNVISGNISKGVRVSCLGSQCKGTVIQGNNIGTNAAGTAKLAGAHQSIGVAVEAGTVTVGGDATRGEGNLISGNEENGVRIEAGRDHKVQGNVIGPGRRLQRIGNGTGIFVAFSRGLKVGAGLEKGATHAGNIVAFNAAEGIYVGPDANGVLIMHNRIYSNGKLGIDLSPPGVNPIGRDGSPGANFWQSFPELSRITTDGRTATVEGILRSRPHRLYAIQFFLNTACDSSGHGEGATLVYDNEVDTDNLGRAAFRYSVPPVLPVGGWVTATATEHPKGNRTVGNTSEFSRCVRVEHP